MIRQFIPQEVCLKCKGCCRFSQEDSVWVPRLLKEEEGVLSEIRVIPSQEGNNFICSFFNPEDNHCKIYAERPFECQLYPFLLKKKSGKIFLGLDLNCPFTKGKIETKEFSEYLNYLIGLLKSQQYAAILKSNPQVIQGYPEAEELSAL